MFLFYSPKIQIKKLNSKTTIISEKLLLEIIYFAFIRIFVKNQLLIL